MFSYSRLRSLNVIYPNIPKAESWTYICSDTIYNVPIFQEISEALNNNFLESFAPLVKIQQIEYNLSKIVVWLLQFLNKFYWIKIIKSNEFIKQLQSWL